jgi:hypothetical protein
MNFSTKFEPTDEIWMYSNPQEVQKKAFDIYGKDAIL